MRGRGVLVVVLLVVAACSGDAGDTSAAPCDLLPLATARELVGQDIERIRVADVVGEDEQEEAAAADGRSCIYAPPGTGAGDEPDTAAAIQLDRGVYRSREQLLAASQVGGILEGIGRAAIIEEEEGGYTVVVLVDDELSFALVVRSPDIERDAVVDLARQIDEMLD